MNIVKGWLVLMLVLVAIPAEAICRSKPCLMQRVESAVTNRCPRWQRIATRTPREGELVLVRRGLLAKYSLRTGEPMWIVDCITHGCEWPVLDNDRWQYFARIDRALNH